MIKYQPDGTIKGLRGVSRNGCAHYPASHVIWLLHHDYLPKRIGRRNGDRTDDRIENLYDMDSGTVVMGERGTVLETFRAGEPFYRMGGVLISKSGVKMTMREIRPLVDLGVVKLEDGNCYRST